MHRFFIPPERIENGNTFISGGQAHQIKEVLRLKSGDQVVALDNTGIEYKVELVEISKNRVKGKVIGQSLCPNEPVIQITLYQTLLKSDKFEWVLQKCTEVGVSRFVPITCERCVVDTPSESRFERWRKILYEAAEQSRRGKISDLDPVIDFKCACEQVDGLSIVPWEQETVDGITAAMSNEKRVNIFIGPEGGFTVDEIEIARNAGIIPITLGKRILRAETAGIVTATIIMHKSGELG